MRWSLEVSSPRSKFDSHLGPVLGSVPRFAGTVPEAAGDYQVLIATNLPEGTNSAVNVEGHDISSFSCCSAVSSGRVVVDVKSDSCHDDGRGNLVAPNLTVTLIVAPNYNSHRDAPPPPSPLQWQPYDVQVVLGPNFENLSGPQVREDAGLHTLSASKDYQLPESTCTGELVPVPGSNGNLKRIAVQPSPTPSA